MTQWITEKDERKETRDAGRKETKWITEGERKETKDTGRKEAKLECRKRRDVYMEGGGRWLGIYYTERGTGGRERESDNVYADIKVKV